MNKFKYNVTLNDVKKLNPCYDPSSKSNRKKMNLIEILNLKNVNSTDKIWLVTQFLDEKTSRLFAVWCARESLKLIKNPDQRSIDAINIAEKFANKKATIEELSAAYSAAYSAARSAASAAYSAASAASSAAYNAAIAAYNAARSAADAAYSAARSAADAAYSAASSAAESAAESAQIKQLKIMIKYKRNKSIKK